MAKPTSQAAAGSSRGMGFRGPSPFHQNEYNSLDELTIFSQREVLDFGSCHKNHYKFKLKHGTFIGETKDHAISCQEACMLFLLVIDMRRKVDRKRAPAIHSPHGPRYVKQVYFGSNGFGKQL
ncbi:hypothetical protein I7I51_04773 [Histoplasma capsulatum]|uniref:Uncharacterized protein n=1 Tax=Ajellomyces capsulatus TaxID=5037 RepID=A0A8A1M703_AJECA|nr:hypothetical protein I7I51_04773 [Histoplasma capsulatum]